MKGISTVIATLLMLVITVALAISAYGYITGLFTSTTSRTIDLADASCTAGSSYFVTVRNTDQFNNISTTELIVRVDDQPITTIVWNPISISANRGVSTGTITNPAGGAAGTAHRIRVIGPTGRPVTLPVNC